MIYVLHIEGPDDEAGIHGLRWLLKTLLRRHGLRCLSVEPKSEAPRHAVSVPEAATMLGISVRTAWGLIADGKLKSIKVSPRRRAVTDAEINRILNGAG